MLTTTVIIGQAQFNIEFDIGNPWRGSRDRYGVPLEPDEEGEITISSITSDGELIDLLHDKVMDMIQCAVESETD